MSRFYTRFNLPGEERTATNSGSKTMPKRIHRVGKKGEDILEIVGETDIYTPRQLSLEQTKLENIIKRCIAGDDSGINAQVGMYIDITESPENLHEAMDMIVRAKQHFYTLSEEEREFYGSPEGYLESITIDRKYTAAVEEKRGETVNESE